MDLNLMTTILPSASTELPEARGNVKGEDASVLPFELALQSELQLLAPLLTDVPGQKSTEACETSDLLDALTSSDPQQSGRPDLQLAILPAADAAATAAATPTVPQLILPPLAPPLPPPPAEEAVTASIPTSPSATVASATLAPMALAAQPRVAEPVSTVPAERTGEKASARITNAATLANAAAGAAPADKDAALPGPFAARVEQTPAQPEPRTTQARMPDVAVDQSPGEKPRTRDELTPRTHAAPAPAMEAERASLVRPEQPIVVDVARTEAPSATAAPSANVSITPAAAFTAPSVSQFTAPQTAAVATAHIQTPLGQSEWADQFREKVVWLVDRQQQTAELHIHPAHLGPVEVMLTLTEDRTSIAFVSPHPAVREAIESSFADLRATLEERGLNLGHASVSADARDAREQLPQNGQPGRRFPGGGVGIETPVQRTLVQRGLVDTFA